MKQTMEMVLQKIIENKIVEVDLSRRDINDSGAKKIAKLLETNTSVTSLNLYKTNITDEGIIKIARTLQTNNTLTLLDIGYNNITSFGAEKLADVIKVNTSLKSLRMYKTKLKKGIIALSEALKLNSTLIEIDLRGNPYKGNLKNKLIEIKKKLVVNSLLQNSALQDRQVNFSKEKYHQSMTRLPTFTHNTFFKASERKSDSVANQNDPHEKCILYYCALNDIKI